jgi:hypothetical protein
MCKCSNSGMRISILLLLAAALCGCASPPEREARTSEDLFAVMNELADLGEKMGADPNSWTIGVPD